MKRAQWNFVVDAAALVAFSAMLSTGLVLRLALPPRSGRDALWGLNRHEWGDVHFCAAAALLGILVLHLALHWRWIACMIQGKPAGAHSGARAVLGAVAALALLGAIVAPLLAPVEERPAGSHREAVEGGEVPRGGGQGPQGKGPRRPDRP